jgi:hypothetical protein
LSRLTHAGAVRAGFKILREGAAEKMLSSISQEGKTAGVLDIDGELIPLVSKKEPLGNYAVSGHVEGQAALIMRRRGAATHARLIIDNPNGICGMCASQTPTLLPEGATLEVTTRSVPCPRHVWF